MRKINKTQNKYYYNYMFLFCMSLFQLVCLSRDQVSTVMPTVLTKIKTWMRVGCKRCLGAFDTDKHSPEAGRRRSALSASVFINCPRPDLHIRYCYDSARAWPSLDEGRFVLKWKPRWLCRPDLALNLGPLFSSFSERWLSLPLLLS